MIHDRNRNAGCCLREILKQGELLIAPGVFDGLSAKLVEQAGFKVVYASGGAIARSTGRPDVGLLSMTEVVDRMAEIVEAVSLPVIGDADTGFGNALNVKRTVHAFRRAGVAALHLEDQQFPKRCGHLAGKQLISSDEMLEKIQAAKQAAGDDMLIIARTDAIAVEGVEAALVRAKQYEQAGADMLFVEAPETEQQMQQIAKVIKKPILINMFLGGKTPLIPIDRLKAMGYSVVIIPSDLQRASIFAMQAVLREIDEQGDSHRMADQLVSFKARENIIGQPG